MKSEENNNKNKETPPHTPNKSYSEITIVTNHQFSTVSFPLHFCFSAHILLFIFSPSSSLYSTNIFRTPLCDRHCAKGCGYKVKYTRPKSSGANIYLRGRQTSKSRDSGWRGDTEGVLIHPGQQL